MEQRQNSVFYIEPEVLLSFDDLTRLPYLYDETVLECIVARYNRNFIYTWAGPILVAVNPFKTLEGFYSSHKISSVSNKIKEGSDLQDPHIYSVSGVAHHRLSSQIGLINQAILVSGESGSGKTESARYLLTYLTHVESERLSFKEYDNIRPAEQVKKRILASNPILEAFGNASTMRNFNSSRFGKLIRLQYAGDNLKGAEIDTYLLEKTRVTFQPVNERNFHIFYQVLAGINHGVLTELGEIEDMEFAIVPGYNKSQDLKDLASYQLTEEAFQAIGVCIERQRQIYQIILVLLHLGNIQFELNDKKDAWIIDSSEENQRHLSLASKLLGLTSESMTEVLTVKKIVVSSSKQSTVFDKVCERREQCEERRDSLMQLLYSSLFSNLVATINANTSVDAKLWTSYLGILDVYGFETFDQNSLEQLCINYTNERLQQEFTRRYLASEMMILSEEGFLDCPLIFTDNTRCVSALDSPTSVFSILNEECQLRRAVNEDITCERVCSALKDTGIVHSPSIAHQKSGFVIKHYAGYVNYASSGLLHKNKDDVPREMLGLLQSSTNQFVARLSFGEEETLSTACDTPTRKLVRKITTLSKFKGSLDSLMKTLKNCDLHYVRCLKPNMNSSPNHIDEPFLCDQLRSNGVLETVKISQAGYPVRILYDEFLRRYNLMKDVNSYSEKEVAFIISSDVLGDGSMPSQDKCRFGKKRIFLSESSLHKLESKRSEYRNNAAICLQKHVKRYAVQKVYKEILKSIKYLQCLSKARLCRIHFLKLRYACIVIQKNTRRWAARKWYKKFRHSIISIQKYSRGWLCRCKYKQLLALKHEESIRSLSRMSYASTGYASMSTTGMAFLTDHSISDAETLVASEEISSVRRNDTARRLLETEESGIETDTESLSGDGVKIGRRSRTKSRRELSNFYRGEGFDHDCASDVDTFDSQLFPERAHYETSPSTDWLEMQASRSSGCSTSNLARRRLFSLNVPSGNIKAQLQRKFSQETRTSKEVPQEPRVATLKRFKDLTNIIKGSSKTESLQIHLPQADFPLFFRDGILSYRKMPMGSIKFHTRSTCLPFSTQLPHQEKPKGLIDAVR